MSLDTPASLRQRLICSPSIPNALVGDSAASEARSANRHIAEDRKAGQGKIQGLDHADLHRADAKK
jgi:hypothetical protein